MTFGRQPTWEDGNRWAGFDMQGPSSRPPFLLLLMFVISWPTFRCGFRKILSCCEGVRTDRGFLFSPVE